MKIYDSLLAEVREFSPREGNLVRMYVCGPTVYDVGHLGHGRSQVAFDLVHRYLLYKGYEVVFVTNWTDIDDKMIERAAQEKISVKELADKIIPCYEKDFGDLRVLNPTVRPLATEYIEAMIKMVKELLVAGFAYEIPGDGVYFDVSKFGEYGKLSKQKLDCLQHGYRVAVNSGKQSEVDFVLWKFKKEGEPFWNDEDGVVADGRPGWHIECSAMCKVLLGDDFDIHGGGQDLVFPHHECEIAQSEALSNKKMANFWMHNGFVNVSGEKMSKSLNNFKTLRDVFQVYSPLVVRYCLLSVHYRAPIDWSELSLEQAKASLRRLQDFYWRILTAKTVQDNLVSTRIVAEEVETALSDFERCLDNDFDISGALGAVFTLLKKMNKHLDERQLTVEERKQLLDFLMKIDEVLAVLDFTGVAFSDEIVELIRLREEARREKNYGLSDELREQLSELGVQSIDTELGSFYR